MYASIYSYLMSIHIIFLYIKLLCDCHLIDDFFNKQHLK